MEEQSNKQVFALDIGTRSLIGIVGHKEGEQFVVEAYEALQHPKRAMIDGQIEDIAQVARVAAEIKHRLEQKLDIKLTRVAVAAAGRALKTCRGSHKKLLSGKAVDMQMSYELESSAVNAARESLSLAENAAQYHCVGHSVVRAAVDGYVFSNLLEHRGREVEVEVIATFLPGEVVSSLRRCMELVDLEIETLTLEPIAAMRAVLPQDIRLLNLAMVDIGAGTSDIAITKDGAVAAYTMATVAGDEVTEAIIRQCLVDFETAEQIKLLLEKEETISYTDILGQTQNTASESILKGIDTSVEMLAKVIAERIEESNGKAPAAVFLVGGGSQTTGLCQKLAQQLGIEENKVALAGTQFSGRVLNEKAGLDAPEHATPVGIALTAAEEMAAGGSFVHVNGHKVRLFIGGEGISVMDVLLLAGYRHADLMGRNGRTVAFRLNGERKVVWGKPHTVALIQRNGEEATLTTPVYGGDVLELVVAKNGEDAHPLVEDFLEEEDRFTVFFDEEPCTVGSVALLNGQLVAVDAEIPEMAELELIRVETVQELCSLRGIDMQNFAVWCNGDIASPKQKLEPNAVFSARLKIPAETHVGSSKIVEPVLKPEEPISAEQEAPLEAEQEECLLEKTEIAQEETGEKPAEPLEETVIEKVVQTQEEVPTEMIAPAREALLQESPMTSTAQAAPTSSGGMRVQLNGKTIVLPPKSDGSQHLLLDLLPLMDIDPENPKGWVDILQNGQSAGYLEPLRMGDSIDIGWKTMPNEM